ncbi:MAG: glutamate 5-kinase [Kiritimatiellae bacterium]|jgi:glutamate 5-kinase|nr:glutamate 5-kinase [Kiritimatiellia bacterium]
MKLEHQYRKSISKVKRVVIKIGTQVITLPTGEPDLNQIKMLSDQIAELHKQNYELLIISSGAVGAGVEAMGMESRPTRVPDLQMCAAIGQAKLMALYDNFFKAHQITIGQVLLTHADFHHKIRLGNAKRTMRHMIKQRVVPIINENDVVADEEIKAALSLGDNNNLAARVVKFVDADLLIILSTVDVVRNNNEAQWVPFSDSVDNAYTLIDSKHVDSEFSKGEMKSKLNAAKNALESDSKVVIANGRTKNILSKIFS